MACYLMGHCFGYHLFVLYHSNGLFITTLDSMVLHVSYMRSLCKKQWCNGHQMVLSGVRHCVAKKFVQF